MKHAYGGQNVEMKMHEKFLIPILLLCTYPNTMDTRHVQHFHSLPFLGDLVGWGMHWLSQFAAQAAP
jgi:hypothetical protein